MIPRYRRLLGLGITLAVAAGCATMPTSSPVMLGGTQVVADGAVGFLAAGPEHGQGPEAVVRGFLVAAQSGPTMPTMFAAAKQYLTMDAARIWRPGEQVWVLNETPALELIPSPDENQVTVRATGDAVAIVSSDGRYHEYRFPVPHTVDFQLHYDGEDWRIAELPDGIIVPAQVFTATYRYTKLYHPSFDYRTWVPDVRWFPQLTWRTNAVQALLAGPPSYLVDVVQPAVPENAAVTLDEITETNHGGIEVRLRGWLRDADGFDRAIFLAQLAMLLTDGSGTQPIGIADNQGPIPVPSYELPALPRTEGPAVAVADEQVYQVSGRELLPAGLDLAGLTPTAIATAPGGADGVVVRSGTSELWWVAEAPADPDAEPGVSAEPAQEQNTNATTTPDLPGEGVGTADLADDGVAENGAADNGAADDATATEPPITTPAGTRVELLTGIDLIAPSIDNEGLVWTGESTGPLLVVDYSGAAFEVTANWLDGTPIDQLSVAPGGRQIAIVTHGQDGTKVLVAGIIRDAQGIPIGLAEPIEVGASVRDVTAVAWQDDAVLAVIGWQAGVHGVYQVGVGGLPAPGGLPRYIPGIAEPRWLTASVGTGNMLAIDRELALHLREATSLWPVVGREVTLVAYPG